MTILTIIGFKIIAKAIIGAGSLIVLGFLVLRIDSKVKRVEKLCDKLREDLQLSKEKAGTCPESIKEFRVDANQVFTKLKPLLYQIDLGNHTIYLCKIINDKTFLIVTIFGDSNLVTLNYRLELDYINSKVKVFGELQKDKNNATLQLDFSHRLMKYCKVLE